MLKGGTKIIKTYKGHFGILKVDLLNKKVIEDTIDREKIATVYHNKPFVNDEQYHNYHMLVAYKTILAKLLDDIAYQGMYIPNGYKAIFSDGSELWLDENGSFFVHNGKEKHNEYL